jgi:hypothetical protein
MSEAAKERVRETWYATARERGVRERDCELVSAAFAYQGFDLALRPDFALRDRASQWAKARRRRAHASCNVQ